MLSLSIADLEHVLDKVGSRWTLLQNKRLLLTGGTGFIGKWMLATFLYANRYFNLSASLVIISRSPDNFLSQFPELRQCKEIEWIIGDIREFKSISSDKYSYAIHAATDVVIKSLPVDVFETCAFGTRRILEVLATKSSKVRLLLLSSGAVYGRLPAGMLSVSEDWSGAPDPLDPASAYGEGKRVSELLCSMATAMNPDFEVAIARCFAFVGPHLPLDKHFAIGNFISAALRGEDIQIHGDGTPLRSYLYAADLAYWLWVMLFDAPSNRAYNVGGAEGISIQDLAIRINRVLSGTGEVRTALQAPLDTLPYAYIPTLDRAIKELDLHSSFSLDDAILRTAQWVRQTGVRQYD